MAAAQPAPVPNVVSLAPGLTEIIFALGQGGRLLAVTAFCDYPPEARRLEAIGGLLDLNLEKIIALNPELVVAYPEHGERLRLLPPAIRVVEVPHRTLADIFASIEAIAGALGVSRQGSELVGAIRSRLEEIRVSCRRKRPQKFLLVADRNPVQLASMWLVGRGDFFDELLRLAGAVNAYDGALAYPQVSVEAAIALQPAAIIELSSAYEQIGDGAIIDFWSRFPFIRAVKEGRIEIVRENFWLRPGPRLAEIAARLCALARKS